MLQVANLATNHIGPVSFELPTGSCTALMGASGSGKSLLLRAIVDLDPNTGDVSADDQWRSSMSARLWRRIVAYVPAESGWWSDRVGDHLLSGAQTDRLLDSIGLPDALTWEVARLSTGERQRLAIARALIQSPKVLLLDEPTASLDADATERIEALIQQCCQSDKTVLVVTHDPDQALRLAQRTLSIVDGKVQDRITVEGDMR